MNPKHGKAAGSSMQGVRAQSWSQKPGESSVEALSGVAPFYKGHWKRMPKSMILSAGKQV